MSYVEGEKVRKASDKRRMGGTVLRVIGRSVLVQWVGRRTTSWEHEHALRRKGEA